MNRATVVYICLFVSFAIGIWVILRIGSSVATAPEDLSGQWQLQDEPPLNAAPSSSPQHGDSSMPPANFRIHQSGKYFQLDIDNGPTLNLILDQNQPDASQSPARQNLTLDGQGWQIVASGSAGSDNYQFIFHPPGSGNAQSPSKPYEYHRVDHQNSDAQPQSISAVQQTANPK